MRIKTACAIVGLLTLTSAAQTAPTTHPSTPPSTTDDTTVARVKSGTMARRFMELHQQYLDRAKQGNVDIVFLGDSITQLWRDAPELWKSRYDPLHAVNFGIMGDVIQHVLWRVEHGELDTIQPKVIVLLIGTNNSKRHNPEPITVGIKHLIDVIHTKTPTSKVLLLAIFPREKTGDVPVQMQNISEVNKELAKLDNGTSIRFLNINDKFYDASGKFRQDLFKDGLHPNPAGYQVWSDAMQPLLMEMLKE